MLFFKKLLLFTDKKDFRLSIAKQIAVSGFIENADTRYSAPSN
jgi:hypothetical protein